MLLGLAAFRVYRLIAEDTILDWPRRYLLRLGSDWQKDGDPVPNNYRAGWAEWLTCPWCAGFWVSVLWWLLWLVFPTFAVFVAVPFAISAFVALVAKNLDRDED